MICTTWTRHHSLEDVSGPVSARLLNTLYELAATVVA